MKRKTKYKSARLNFFVALICLSVSAGSLWLFFKDLNSSSSRSDKEAIATISFKYKIAQRKFNDRVVWERLQQDAPLYEGDTIHTADLAQATIYFKEGTSIEISENSMVQLLQTDDGGVKLSVTGGQVDVDTTNSQKEVQLDMGSGMVVALDTGSKISAKLDGENGVGLDMKAGNAKVQGENGEESTSLKVGQSVKISEGGKITHAPITVTSVSENQRVLVFTENKKDSSVPLEWFPVEQEKGEKPKQIIVETSNKKDFSAIKTTYNVSDLEKTKVDIPAEDGAVYWRAYVEGEKEDAVSGKLSFEAVNPVVTTSPENKEVFTFFKDSPNVNFAWRGNKQATKYKIEISKNPNLEKPEISREVTSQILTVSNLQSGKYYWRVTPFYETNKIGWFGETEIKSFELEKRVAPEPPSLTFPANEKKITYMGDAPDTKFDADFSWKGENIDSNYTLEISKDRAFKNVVFKKETKSKSLRESFTVASLPAGEYFWKVTQNFSEEISPLVSETRKFSVAKFIPEQNRLLYPEDSYSIESEGLQTLAFMWKISKENENIFASSATKIQFSSTADFKTPILEKEVSGSSLKNVELKTGKYYWRVTKGDSFTDTRVLNVLGRLSRPEVTYPKLGETVLFTGGSAGTGGANPNATGNRKLDLRWKAATGADYYTIKVTDTTTKETILDSQTKATKISLSLPNVASKLNNYSINIQAFTNESKQTAPRKSETAESRFSTRLASPVKIISPAQKTALNGLNALKNGVTLKWAKGLDSYTTATVNLWKIDANGKSSLVESFKNPKEIITVPRLTEGNYRWNVKAVGKDGISLDSETATFEVLKVAELERAVLIEPAKNKKIDAEYLKNNRSIAFSWKQVEGATDYNFVLYQKMPNGALKKVYSSEKQTSTNARIKDLKILDVGSFQWQVTATSRAKDGFIYQKGKVSTGEFTIDFSAPKKVETIDPGVMYGE